MMHVKHFTLVEVLISMAVLAVFLLGLLHFYSMSQNTMSLAADRSELFERARIAMDMMTQDISCVYYSQDEEDLVPFLPKSNSKSTEFSVVTIRPEKIKTSAGKTPVTAQLGVKYKWDSGKHILYYSSDSGRDTFSLDDATFGSETELIPGVTDFYVEADYTTSECKSLPASVTISFELIDKTTLRRLENTKNNAILNNAPRRRFSRTVYIDRGQRKIK